VAKRGRDGKIVLQFGVRRLVAAFDGRIHPPALYPHSGVTEGEMNFAFEGGDESPHSKRRSLISRYIHLSMN